MSSSIQPDRLKTLLCDMVDIYSPSGKEEELSEFLAAFLYEHDLPVTLREVSEGRRNVEVVFSDTRPEIAFIGHIDTVPAYDYESYECVQRGSRIHGLGTADMKGGCAAMIEAFVSLCQSGAVPERAALFLVVGEEESGDGTAALLKARSFPWALVAEPTNLVPCLSHFGYMEMRIRAFGQRRHASKANREHNAIMSMLQMILNLGRLLETAHPDTVLNVRDVHSAESGFAVPGSCEAWLDLHMPPDADPQALSAELRRLVESSFAQNALARYELDFPLLACGYNLDEGGLLPTLLAEVYRNQDLSWAPGAFESHSDANLLRAAGCRPVILGPGHLGAAHTSDESVCFDQVTQAANIYYTLLSRLTL